MDSPDKEVKKAVDLCHSHLPQSSSSTQPSRSSRISTLWKTQQEATSQAPVDKVNLASAVLGEQLVQTITQKHREPPDVSCLHVLNTRPF